MNVKQLARLLGEAKIDFLSSDPNSYEVVYKLPPVCSKTQIRFFRFMSPMELAFHTICDFAQEFKEFLFEPIDSDELMVYEGFQKFAKLNESAQNTYRANICLLQFRGMLKSAVKLLSYETMIEMVNMIIIEDILES